MLVAGVSACNGSVTTDLTTPASVPEPASAALLGAGLLAFELRRRG